MNSAGVAYVASNFEDYHRCIKLRIWVYFENDIWQKSAMSHQRDKSTLINNVNFYLIQCEIPQLRPHTRPLFSPRSHIELGGRSIPPVSIQMSNFSGCTEEFLSTCPRFWARVCVGRCFPPKSEELVCNSVAEISRWKSKCQAFWRVHVGIHKFDRAVCSRSCSWSRDIFAINRERANSFYFLASKSLQTNRRHP